MPTTRSRVDCGFALVILSFCPMIRLSRVDLPAFGRPTTVTIPAWGMQRKVRSDIASDNAKHKAPAGILSSGSAAGALDLGGGGDAATLARGCRRRPTLPRPRGRSTIGAAGLNGRVRDGNGCGPCALVASDLDVLSCVSETMDCSGNHPWP